VAFEGITTSAFFRRAHSKPGRVRSTMRSLLPEAQTTIPFRCCGGFWGGDGRQERDFRGLSGLGVNT
jgi:hypothetical protein